MIFSDKFYLKIKNIFLSFTPTIIPLILQIFEVPVDWRPRPIEILTLAQGWDWMTHVIYIIYIT